MKGVHWLLCDTGQIGEYIPFNYPALLASYKHFLAMDSPIVPEELRLLRPAALERLNIGRFVGLRCKLICINVFLL